VAPGASKSKIGKAERFKGGSVFHFSAFTPFSFRDFSLSPITRRGLFSAALNGVKRSVQAKSRNWESRGRKSGFCFLVSAFCFCLCSLLFPVWAADNCTVCDGPLERVAYFFQDKVAGDKKQLCEKCAHLNRVCYLCGLPAKDDFQELSDGRILCGRDVKAVVLDENEAQQIWEDVKDAVERQFSRFIAFPANITVQPLDRVDLLALFKVPGNDFVCPNVWGCTQRQTNASRVSYKISLLRGLPARVLKATCAHELTHTWISENVPASRKQRMDQDAIEGFCELVAYLYVAAQNDEAQMDVIKSNTYTRGQFALFLEAEHGFGFNEIVDWMKYGVDFRLTGADLGRVRKVEMPGLGNAESANAGEENTERSKSIRAVPDVRVSAPPSALAPTAPETLVLKGITWSKTRPMALINNHTFAANEEGNVRLGPSNVLIRCVAIREDSVVVQVVGSNEPRTLSFAP